jgi:hypothetical protein
MMVGNRRTRTAEQIEGIIKDYTEKKVRGSKYQPHQGKKECERRKRKLRP